VYAGQTPAPQCTDPAIIDPVHKRDRQHAFGEISRLSEVEALQIRAEDLVPEERQLLNLLLVLVEDYEERKFRIKAAAPDEVLRELMRVRGTRQKDLLEVFGSKGIASEVVCGRRAISRTQAKRLARFFHVSPALFL
jgi:HTH-type transcriptional regulator / antitoxin HigA